jgi:hypothetical protein
MELSRRLVVTGHDPQGRSCVASNNQPSSRPIPGFPGYGQIDFWGADETLTFPDAGEKPSTKLYFPPVGGFRFIEICMPPKTDVSHDTSPNSAIAEQLKAEMPGLVEMMDADRPGMHRTATVDIIIMMEGSCELELEAETVTLHAGDTLVQSGTIHAWHNPFDKPSRFLAVMFGAHNNLMK